MGYIIELQNTKVLKGHLIVVDKYENVINCCVREMSFFQVW